MLIITGTYPPRKCGVGDYCKNLMSTETACSWNIYTHENWALSSFFSKKNDLKNINFKIANIQYPSMGYGTSLLPHILAIYIKIFLRRKLIVTFHEYSQLGWKGQLASYLFFKMADKIIFTTEFERQYAIKKNKFIKNKSSIIKIFSNIKVIADNKSFNERKFDIGYFGYIRPDKGIEEYIATAKQFLKVNPKANIYIMGQTQDEYKSYNIPLLESIKDTGIKLLLNYDINDVSTVLADTKIAYLPYPDGLTERRGSFLAALLHHCIIVTTKGKFTTEAQLTTFNFVNKEVACDEIKRILNLSEEKICKKLKEIDNYIIAQVPSSWEYVAKQYDKLIKLLS